MDRRIKLSLGILMLASHVLGCVSLPPAEQPVVMRAPELVEVARSTTAGRGQWPASHWWEKFGDNQLNDFVKQALSANPSLDIARARLRGTLQTARLAGARLGPELSGYASIDYERFSGTGLFPPPIGGTTATEGELGLDLSYAFDFWGKNRALQNSALDRAKVAEAENAAAELFIAAAVTQTYYRYQTELKRLGLARRIAALRAQLVSLNRSRVDQGLVPVTVLRLNQRDLAGQRQSVTAIETSLAIRKEQLRALLGAGPADLGAIKDGPLPDPESGLPERLGLDLLARRPDVAASRWQVEAAVQDMRSAETQFYPDVNLRALAGFSTITLRHLLDFDSRSWDAGIAIHLPIFDAGRLRANLGVSRADLDQAVAQYNLALLEAVREVAQHDASLQGLKRQRLSLAESREADKKIATAVGSRARQGLASAIESLEAELPLLTAEDTDLQLQGLELAAKVDLIKSLGGGYLADAFPSLSPGETGTTRAQKAEK